MKVGGVVGARTPWTHSARCARECPLVPPASATSARRRGRRRERRSPERIRYLRATGPGRVHVAISPCSTLTTSSKRRRLGGWLQQSRERRFATSHCPASNNPPKRWNDAEQHSVRRRHRGAWPDPRASATSPCCAGGGGRVRRGAKRCSERNDSQPATARFQPPGVQPAVVTGSSGRQGGVE